MNRLAAILTSLILGTFVTLQIHAQCEADTVYCEDTGDPGQICPLILPTAGLDALYDEVVTVIPPGSYSIGGFEVAILHIKIDSLLNLPPGIDYYPNADTLYPDTAYCIQLTGIPTQTGEFPLSIYISATVNLGDFNLTQQVVDDSSVVLTVVGNLGVEPDPAGEFQVFQNVPNPFSDRTSLAFYTPVENQVELSVYNILGVLVHREAEIAAPGRHMFRFDGTELQPGTYLYRVESGEAYHTGKFMKSR